MSFRASPIRAFSRMASRLLHEAHPVGRYPTTMAAHRPNPGFYASKLWRTASWYVPLATGILGWPIAAAYVLKRTGI